MRKNERCIEIDEVDEKIEELVKKKIEWRGKRKERG